MAFADQILADGAMTVQPDGKVIIGLFSGRVCRLETDGSVDPTFHSARAWADFTNPYFMFVARQADGKILVSGGFSSIDGVARTNLARINVDGTVDESFPAVGVIATSVPGIGAQMDGTILLSRIGNSFVRLRPDGTVLEMTEGLGRVSLIRVEGSSDVAAVRQYDEDGVNFVRWIRGSAPAFLADFAFENATSGGPGGPILPQTDGGVLFQTFGGGQIPSAPSLRRLKMDGSVDTSYELQGLPVGSSITALVPTPGHKTIVGGTFTNLAGQRRRGSARLLEDGSLDAGYSPAESGPNLPTRVRAIAVQPDNKVLIAGYSGVARLNSDGSADLTFNIGKGLAGVPYSDPEFPSYPYAESIVLQPDGKIVVGGVFTNVNGLPRNGIVRLREDGNVDETFAPHPNYPAISYVAVQGTNKLLILGGFTNINGVPRRGFARLNMGGDVDVDFPDVPDVLNARVNAIAVQANGKVLIGGSFTSIGGVPRNSLARLNADGTVDENFFFGMEGPSSGSQGGIGWITSREDGRIIVVGSFEIFNGRPRTSIAQLWGDETLGVALNCTDGNVRIAWSVTEGARYQIQCARSFVQPDWSNVGDPLIATSINPSIILASDSPALFFRVVRLP